MALLTRRDPFADLMALQRDLVRDFSRLFSDVAGPMFRRLDEGVTWAPAVDVFSKGDDLIMRVELPGVKPEDIEITCTKDELTVKGERREHKEVTESDYIMRESSYGSFERHIALPEGVNVDDIRADYEAGILEITAPKAAAISAPERKKIPITAKAEEKKEAKAKAA